MAKKATAEDNVEVAPQPIVTKTAPGFCTYLQNQTWEIKDRLYTLATGNGNPLGSLHNMNI